MTKNEMNSLTIEELAEHVERMRVEAFPSDGSRLEGAKVRAYTEANLLLAKRKCDADRDALAKALADAAREDRERRRNLREAAMRCGQWKF